MPVIKVDLPQEVLEKLAIIANRHMVATRVMAADVIAAYINAAQPRVQPTGGQRTGGTVPASSIIQSQKVIGSEGFI